MCLPGGILPNSCAMHPVSDNFDYFCSLEYAMLICLIEACRIASRNYWAGSKSGQFCYAGESDYKQSLKYHRNVE